MKHALPDSHLNQAEHALQHSFRKTRLFNGLLMGTVVLATYVPMRALPDRPDLADRLVALHYEAVGLPRTASPFRVAGAWEMAADDRRFGGLSALAIENGQFLAVSDLGAVAHFDPPSSARPAVRIMDLSDGPGPLGRKTSRDAESLTRDPLGRGWWIGFEQRHSLWLYDKQLLHALAAIPLKRPDWWRNRGIEGLVADGKDLLAFAENGREAFRIGDFGIRGVAFTAGSDVADAARAPDGGIWVLLRSKGSGGINQSIAKLMPAGSGFRLGSTFGIPKGAFDNFEGMVIAPRPNGDWRFWLVTDDGHRIMTRNLLVALDLPATENARRKPPGAL